MAASKLLMKPKVPLAMFRKMQDEVAAEQRDVLSALKNVAIDSFSNPAARLGFGTSNMLEATQYPLTRLSRNYILMVSLYRSNWIVRKVVDAKAEDMVKNGWSYDTETTPEMLSDLEKVCDDTQISAKLAEALKWARLYGGSAALMVLKGQRDLESPLDIEDVISILSKVCLCSTAGAASPRVQLL